VVGPLVGLLVLGMPFVETIRPIAALPGGELELTGTGLGPGLIAEVSGVEAIVTLARPTRATLKISEGTLPGDLIVTQDHEESIPRHVQIAVPMAENLHPVGNPAADAEGNVYTTLSGSRGQQTPVSIFRIAPAPSGMTHELRPFVRDILNPSGVAFSPGGDLYVSSRADGIVYRISPSGTAVPFVEGLGIATGIAFDEQGDLYVGDRSGTIFKIRIDAAGKPTGTFVFATLEPSIAFYHLAFSIDGTLYVTGPTTASSQVIYAIDRDGSARIFFRGLGRAQGMAFDVDDNLYIAASLHGERGIVRIGPALETGLIVSGSNLIGLCFLANGHAALATRDAVYEVELGIRGAGL
jgi:sugar lactone lactonase YvrE